MKGYEEHSFYCLNCGNRGIPIRRKIGHQHGAGHRKKLYCPNCRVEVNHMECRTQSEIEEFKINFVNGVYTDEAEKSICMCRDTWKW